MTAPVLNPGTVVDHYILREKIGEGGMGAVFLARDEKLGRDVALKFISAHLVANEEARQLFRREALTLSKLNHPNVETLFDFEANELWDYIVLEYVSGESIDKLLKAGPLPISEYFQCGNQLLAGVGAAHAMGVLHRDLKPGNLKLTSDHRLKILDFGLAKLVHVAPDDLTQSFITRDSVPGTLPYMAPEQLRGKADQRSDLFSCAAVLYECATGRRPFAGETSADLINAIFNQTPEVPSRLNPLLPKELDRVLLHGLEKNADKRFQTAEEFARAFNAAAPTHRSKAGIVVGMVALFVVAIVLAMSWRIRSATSSVAPAKTETERVSKVPAANHAYNRGIRVITEQMNVEKAGELFLEASNADPTFADARCWYGFSELLMLDSGLSQDREWIYKAEKDVRAGLEMDDSSSRCHSALGAVAYYQGRFDELERETKRAIQIDPNHADGPLWLSLYYQIKGDFPKSQELLLGVLKNDPFFFPARMNLGDNYRQMGEPEKSITEQQKILDVDPQNAYAMQYAAIAYLEMDKPDEAEKVLRKARSDLRQNLLMRTAWAFLYAYRGEKVQAQHEMTPELIRYLDIYPNQACSVAEIYSLLGDKDKALTWLERAVRNGDDRGKYFERDPFLKNIRSEPRFKQLLESIEYRTKSSDRS